ncbi:hypothetical protein HZA56_08990 [Candidatus Poribacteria bacterium]|nr:hypothetical protein [Candidatus Poribacteria bacterium]
MTRKEVHDVANIIAPALTLAQSLLLDFYGEMAGNQREAVVKIEKCLKELQGYLQQQTAKRSKKQ